MSFVFMEVPGGKPIKAWVNGVQLEDSAKKQLTQTVFILVLTVPVG